MVVDCMSVRAVGVEAEVSEGVLSVGDDWDTDSCCSAEICLIPVTGIPKNCSQYSLHEMQIKKSFLLQVRHPTASLKTSAAVSY